MKIGKYELYGTLGEGAFGKVKYAENIETKENVAVKILDKEKIQSRNMGAQIKKEISLTKMIQHRFVVGVKDVFATNSKIFIVLEFVSGGELFDKIANEGKMNDSTARFYFAQIIEGMEFCHNQGISHRDLKPENLLMDKEGNVKITDFGFATLSVGDVESDGTELQHTMCGTPNYVAPEILGKGGYDGRTADIWSMGVILYVLLAGYLPFEENTIAALFVKVKKAEFEFPDWFSADAKDLISKILTADPHTRYTIKQIRHHKWFTDNGKIDPEAPARTCGSKDEVPLPPPPTERAKIEKIPSSRYKKEKPAVIDPNPPKIPEQAKNEDTTTTTQNTTSPQNSANAPAVDKSGCVCVIM